MRFHLSDCQKGHLVLHQKPIWLRKLPCLLKSSVDRQALHKLKKDTSEQLYKAVVVVLPSVWLLRQNECNRTCSLQRCFTYHSENFVLHEHKRHCDSRYVWRTSYICDDC